MAMIVDAFAGKLMERLTNVIEEKAIMVLGVKDDLQKLQRRMQRIERVLKDAERRRIQDETVKGWVDELKDVMYDADDIIDLCMIQGTGVLLQDDDHHTQLAESSAAASTREERCVNIFTNSVESLMMITSSCIWSAMLKYWRLEGCLIGGLSPWLFLRLASILPGSLSRGQKHEFEVYQRTIFL